MDSTHSGTSNLHAKQNIGVRFTFIIEKLSLMRLVHAQTTACVCSKKSGAKKPNRPPDKMNITTKTTTGKSYGSKKSDVKGDESELFCIRNLFKKGESTSKGVLYSGFFGGIICFADVIRLRCTRENRMKIMQNCHFFNQ